MLFRPSFCCKCGEKIERAEWKLWTSRRFCDLCATDFTLQEIIPRVIVVLATLVSVFGIVNYFAPLPNRQNFTTVKAFEKPNFQSPVIDKGIANSVSTPALVEKPPPANPVEERSKTLASMRVPTQNSIAKPEMAVPVYFCGAETKKGTPCSRKVKGSVRCWQHEGQPAMLPPDKLLVSR